MKNVVVKRLLIIASLFAMLALVNTNGNACVSHQEQTAATQVIAQTN